MSTQFVNNTPERKVSLPVLALAFVLAVVSLGIGVRHALNRSIDFQVNYYTSRMILLGENPYRLKLNGTLDDRARAILGDVPSLDPDYFPSAMLPVILLSFLPLEIAKAVWLLTNLACGAVFLFALWSPRSSVPPARHLALCLFVWVASTPFRNSLGVGQCVIFSVGLTFASIRAVDAGCSRLGGVLLALGVYKYALVWPVVLFFFCLAPRRIALAWAAAIHLCVHLTLCWRMHAHPIQVFAEAMRGSSDIFERNLMFTIWMPWRILAGRLGSWEVPATTLGALTLLGLLAILGRFWLQKRAGREPRAWFGLLCLLAVIAVSTRPYALAFTPAIWLCVAGPQALSTSEGRRWRIIAYILFLSIVQPLTKFFVHGISESTLILWLINPALILLCAEFTLLISSLMATGRGAPPSQKMPDM